MKNVLEFPAEPHPAHRGHGPAALRGRGHGRRLLAGARRPRTSPSSTPCGRSDALRKRWRISLGREHGLRAHRHARAEAAQLPDPAGRDGGRGHRHHDGQLRGGLQQPGGVVLHAVRHLPGAVPEVRAALRRPGGAARGPAQPPRPHHRGRGGPEAPVEAGGGGVAGAVPVRRQHPGAGRPRGGQRPADPGHQPRLHRGQHPLRGRRPVHHRRRRHPPRAGGRHRQRRGQRPLPPPRRRGPGDHASTACPTG